MEKINMLFIAIRKYNGGIQEISRLYKEKGKAIWQNSSTKKLTIWRNSSAK